MPAPLYLILGLTAIGFICQLVGAFRLKGELIMVGFFIQAAAILIAIPFVV